MIWPEPRDRASGARERSVRRNLVLRMGSSHRGPSRVAQVKPWVMLSRTVRRRKGLGEEVSVGKFLEKELWVGLREGGVLGNA